MSTPAKIETFWAFCETLPAPLRTQEEPSRYILGDYIKGHEKSPRLWFAFCMARAFNRVATIKALGFPAQETAAEWREHALAVLSFLFACDAPTFSQTYKIAPHGRKGSKGKGIILDSLAPALVYFSEAGTFETPRKMQTIWEILTSHLALGPIVCAEAAADMRHSYHYPRRGGDALSWCYVSPRAVFSLRKIFGHELTQAQALDLCAALWETRPSFLRRAELIDIEHCLSNYYTITHHA